ncbi:BREX-2 system phosphatase PglZ [Streptomyces sp. NPDC085524]|uniref:BREX-2 system phosphatase PglZ n=1 Tax=Streptomyces sp. NPDC085524 TaxID=3365728 RepID=UPI0037CFF630
MPIRPVVGRRIIEALLETELARGSDRRLILVNARYESAGTEDEFIAKIGGRQRRVQITDQDSVLGITDAWARLADRYEEGLVVVTSGVPTDQLGWDVKAHAVRRHTLTVDRAEIVKQLFGATDLDPRLYEAGWLLDALLEAEPHDGWPRAGAVLTLDTATRSLVAARLGLGDPAADSSDLDTDTLLAWSGTTAGPILFSELAVAERTGIADWLTRSVGPAVPTLLSLVADGRGRDAMPLGALASAVRAPGASDAATFALGSLFGSALKSFDDLAPFSNAVTGVLARWITEAEGTGPHRTDARERVFTVLDQADTLAHQAGLGGALGEDRLLPSGFKARLRGLAVALARSPGEAESALERLEEHQLSGLYEESTAAARMAVRMARWLAGPAPWVESVPQAVSEQFASWGWADRALAVLAEGDPERDPVLGQAYHRLIGAVQDRRAKIDEQFGARLAAWTEFARQPEAPGGALLIEDVLGRVAAPLALEDSRPLILVLDGMSTSVAVQLGAELDRRVWTEIVPKPEEGRSPARQAAVAMLPTITSVSRASLLSGAPTRGGQSAEDTGFAAFWKKRHRTAILFHKGEFEGEAGHRLAPMLLEALASDAVVGVVLNTIDEALDHGQQGARTNWHLKDVSKLPDLLNAARDYGRPVLLVSDHGHVIDRTPAGQGPVTAPGAQSARWRKGSAADGEVVLTGPRVLEGGGTITAPWREDIRYTPRKAGYHGGAALAEVAVPVIALVPSAELIPSGWTILPGERIAPDWWRSASTRAGIESEAEQSSTKKRGKTTPTQEGEALFARREVVKGPDTLGGKAVATAQFKAQREFVRHAPTDKAVAAVIDALADAGGKLSPGAVAAAAQAATGKSQRNPERFVTVLQRLLNIDGYAVVSLIEAGRTVELNKTLLEQQFFGTGQR